MSTQEYEQNIKTMANWKGPGPDGVQQQQQQQQYIYTFRIYKIQNHE